MGQGFDAWERFESPACSETSIFTMFSNGFGFSGGTDSAARGARKNYHFLMVYKVPWLLGCPETIFWRAVCAKTFIPTLFHNALKPFGQDLDAWERFESAACSETFSSQGFIRSLSFSGGTDFGGALRA